MQHRVVLRLNEKPLTRERMWWWQIRSRLAFSTPFFTLSSIFNCLLLHIFCGIKFLWNKNHSQLLLHQFVCVHSGNKCKLHGNWYHNIYGIVWLCLSVFFARWLSTILPFCYNFSFHFSFHLHLSLPFFLFSHNAFYCNIHVKPAMFHELLM